MLEEERRGEAGNWWLIEVFSKSEVVEIWRKHLHRLVRFKSSERGGEVVERLAKYVRDFQLCQKWREDGRDACDCAEHSENRRKRYEGIAGEVVGIRPREKVVGVESWAGYRVVRRVVL